MQDGGSGSELTQSAVERTLAEGLAMSAPGLQGSAAAEGYRFCEGYGSLQKLGAEPTSARPLQGGEAVQEGGAGRELAAQAPRLGGGAGGRGGGVVLCMSRH